MDRQIHRRLIGPTHTFLREGLLKAVDAIRQGIEASELHRLYHFAQECVRWAVQWPITR